MSAKSFQTTTGVQKFIDQDALGTDRIEPDKFYYDVALRMIERERDKGPMFLFVYLAQNHYPWNYRWRPDLMPEWKEPGNNKPEVDEYLRRQTMSFRDYAELRDRLKREFPGESFLLVRYGDHQPDFASTILEPALDEVAVNRRLMTYDPRYFTTYYAIDAINFKPVNLGVRARHHRGPLSPAGRAGGGRPAARSVVRRAEADPRALQGAVLCLRRRRGGAPLQSAPDRRRPDQGALGSAKSPAVALPTRKARARFCPRVRGYGPRREGTALVRLLGDS